MIIDHMILLITSCYQHGNLHHLHFCPTITTLVPALIIIHFNLTFYPNYYPRFLIYSSPVYLICCCSAAKRCLTLCNPMDCSTPGFPVLHYLLELAQTPVHWVSDAIQPSHPLPPLSPPALNLSQHQGLLQWLGPSHQVAKVLELQHQSFQWTFRVDFL